MSEQILNNAATMPIATPKKKRHWFRNIFLIFVGLILLLVFLMILASNSGNFVARKDFMGVHLLNRNEGPITIVGITVNDSPDCTRFSDMKFPRTLKEGEELVYYVSCNAMRVKVQTHDGTETYYFSE